MGMMFSACKLVHKAEKRRFNTLTGPYLWNIYFLDDLQRWQWEHNQVEQVVTRT